MSIEQLTEMYQRFRETVEKNCFDMVSFDTDPFAEYVIPLF